MYPFLLGDLGGPELLIIMAVLVLLFGAKKLPELARGSGQALRIFKAETKRLSSDEPDDVVVPPLPVEAVRVQPVDLLHPQPVEDLRPTGRDTAV